MISTPPLDADASVGGSIENLTRPPQPQQATALLRTQPSKYAWHPHQAREPSGAQGGAMGGASSRPTRREQRGNRRREVTSSNHAKQKHEQSLLAIISARAKNRIRDNAKSSAERGNFAGKARRNNRRQRRPCRGRVRNRRDREIREQRSPSSSNRRQGRAQVRPRSTHNAER